MFLLVRPKTSSSFFNTFPVHIEAFATKFYVEVVFSKNFRLSPLTPFLSKRVMCGQRRATRTHTKFEKQSSQLIPFQTPARMNQLLPPSRFVSYFRKERYVQKIGVGNNVYFGFG